MRPRSVLFALLAVSLLVTTGCGSLKRTGTDIAVVVTSPLNVPLSAAQDSLEWEEHTSSAAPVLLFPFNFVLHGVKHIAYTGVYFGDLFLAPLYLPASITPQRDLDPIDLYSLENGFPWKSAPVPEMEDKVAGT